MNNRFIFFLLITVFISLSNLALATDCDVERARRLTAQYNEMLAKGDYEGIRRIRKERESLLPGNCFPKPTLEDRSSNNTNNEGIIPNPNTSPIVVSDPPTNNTCPYERNPNFCNASSNIETQTISKNSGLPGIAETSDLIKNTLSKIPGVVDANADFSIYGSITTEQQCCENCSILQPVESKTYEIGGSLSASAKFAIPGWGDKFEKSFFRGYKIEANYLFGPQGTIEMSSSLSVSKTLSECQKDSCFSINLSHPTLTLTGELGAGGSATVSQYEKTIFGAALQGGGALSGSGGFNGFSAEFGGSDCGGITCSFFFGPVEAYGYINIELEFQFFSYSHEIRISRQIMAKREKNC